MKSAVPPVARSSSSPSPSSFRTLSVRPEQKLRASHAGNGDDTGMSMAVSGDTAIVGAPGTASRRGAAHVFVRSGETWSLQQTLVVSDTSSFDNFGWAVAIEGDVAIVGAVGKDAKGAAYVFIRNGSAWSLEQRLSASDGQAGDFFGSSLALSRDTAIVGANQKAGLQGAAYVFARSANGWFERQKLTATDAGDQDSFGYAVSLCGDTVVVGACGRTYNTGAAYVFARSGDTWSQAQKLVASDGSQGDSFGISVATSADTVIVGSYATENRQGAAYVFARSNGAWAQQQKLVASDSAASDYFGVSVAVNEDTAVIGAYGKSNYRGAAYVFGRTYETWTEQQKLTAQDAKDYDSFGSSVASSGGITMVGASRNANHGSAYAFALHRTAADEARVSVSPGIVPDAVTSSVARLRSYLSDTSDSLRHG